MPILLDAFLAILFVLSSGLFFTERFRKNLFLVICAGLIATVSSTLLGWQVWRWASLHFAPHVSTPIPGEVGAGRRGFKAPSPPTPAPVALPAVPSDAKPDAGSHLGIVRRLALDMVQIDDLGLVVVITPSGRAAVVGSAEWRIDNLGGSGSVDLDPALETGRNTVLFILHNKQWIFGAGKWGFSVTLMGDGKELWHAERFKPNGKFGIRYWDAFSATRQSDGTITVDKAPQATIDRLQPRIAALHEQLIRSYGSAPSTYSSDFNPVIARILSDEGAAGDSTKDATSP